MLQHFTLVSAFDFDLEVYQKLEVTDVNCIFYFNDGKDITDADHSPICVPSIHFYISYLRKSRHESRFMAGKIQIMQTTFKEPERKIITKIANDKKYSKCSPIQKIARKQVCVGKHSPNFAQKTRDKTNHHHCSVLFAQFHEFLTNFSKRKSQRCFNILQVNVSLKTCQAMWLVLSQNRI